MIREFSVNAISSRWLVPGERTRQLGPSGLVFVISRLPTSSQSRVAPVPRYVRAEIFRGNPGVRHLLASRAKRADRVLSPPAVGADLSYQVLQSTSSRRARPVRARLTAVCRRRRADASRHGPRVSEGRTRVGDGGGGNRTRVLRMLRHRRGGPRIRMTANRAIPARMSRTNPERTGGRERDCVRGRGVRRR